MRHIFWGTTLLLLALLVVLAVTLLLLALLVTFSVITVLKIGAMAPMRVHGRLSLMTRPKPASRPSVSRVAAPGCIARTSGVLGHTAVSQRKAGVT